MAKANTLIHLRASHTVPPIINDATQLKQTKINLTGQEREREREREREKARERQTEKLEGRGANSMLTPAPCSGFPGVVFTIPAYISVLVEILGLLPHTHFISVNSCGTHYH